MTDPTPSSSKKYLRRSDLAKRYSCHERTIDRMAADGRIPKPTITTRNRFPLWDQETLDEADREAARVGRRGREVERQDLGPHSSIHAKIGCAAINDPAVTEPFVIHDDLMEPLNEPTQAQIEAAMSEYDRILVGIKRSGGTLTAENRSEAMAAALTAAFAIRRLRD